MNASSSNPFRNFLYIIAALFLIGLYVEICNFNAFMQNEIRSARVQFNENLQGGRADVVEQVSGIRKDFLVVSDKLDKRIASIEINLVKEVQTTRTETLQRVDSIHQDVLPVRDGLVALTKTYNEIPNSMERRFGSYIDCEKNALCLQGQVVDTLFALRTTSRDFSSTSAVLADNMAQITSNVRLSTDTFNKGFPTFIENTNSVAKNVNKITTPKWYDRIITYATTGSLLYFNILGGSGIAKTATK